MRNKNYFGELNMDLIDRADRSELQRDPDPAASKPLPPPVRLPPDAKPWELRPIASHVRPRAANRSEAGASQFESESA